MKKIAIIPNIYRDDTKIVAMGVANELLKYDTELYMPADCTYGDIPEQVVRIPCEDIFKKCDAIIAIGGDGTIIGTARDAAAFKKPVLGINAGRLGFMAGLERNELHELKRLVSGDYCIQNRMMLEMEYDSGDGKIYSLNDIVISRANISRIVDLNVSCDGSHVNSYRADGLIVSTPTGSTAYSLSAGGPVVDPQINCMLLTPICPHSLFSRTIMFRPDLCIEIETNCCDGDMMVTIDGHDTVPVSGGEKIRIKCSDRWAELIKIKDEDFYDVLREKLTKRSIAT